ncbi:unnamed protein product [Gongylonema pulchrum]|uniref:Ribosomal_L18A domain-containing protein n=1 Tax=Gongylonema pulchrum TaxID=637853 RepID=A0A183DHV9_9BILA|nr:unnamed protein product [Gongylonema pulchrum]
MDLKDDSYVYFGWEINVYLNFQLETAHRKVVAWRKFYNIADAVKMLNRKVRAQHFNTFVLKAMPPRIRDVVTHKS